MVDRPLLDITAAASTLSVMSLTPINGSGAAATRVAREHKLKNRKEEKGEGCSEALGRDRLIFSGTRDSWMS